VNPRAPGQLFARRSFSASRAFPLALRPARTIEPSVFSALSATRLGLDFVDSSARRALHSHSMTGDTTPRAPSAAAAAAAARALAALDWTLTPAGIADKARSIIADSTAVLDAVAAARGAPSAASVLEPLAALDARLEGAASSVTFVKDVSPDAAVREAASAAAAELAA
jgi:thimet oligopeptidase